MSSITAWVEHFLEQRPFLQEALRHGIINYSALGSQLQELIEKDLRKDFSTSAVIIAIRRYRERLSPIKLEAAQYGPMAEATLKTNIGMLSYQKSEQTYSYFGKLAQFAANRSDYLHLTQGIHNWAVITNDQHLPKIKKILKEEHLIREDPELAILALRYSSEVTDKPGALYMLAKALAWANIPIYNEIEAVGESVFIIHANDAVRGLEAVTSVIRR